MQIFSRYEQKFVVRNLLNTTSWTDKITFFLEEKKKDVVGFQGPVTRKFSLMNWTEKHEKGQSEDGVEIINKNYFVFCVFSPFEDKEKERKS